MTWIIMNTTPAPPDIWEADVTRGGEPAIAAPVIGWATCHDIENVASGHWIKRSGVYPAVLAPWDNGRIVVLHPACDSADLIGVRGVGDPYRRADQPPTSIGGFEVG